MPAACDIAPGKSSLKLSLRAADSQENSYKLMIGNLQCLNSQMLTMLSFLRRGLKNQKHRCAALNMSRPLESLANMASPPSSTQCCSCKAPRKWQQPSPNRTCCSAQLLQPPCAPAFAAQAACQWHSPEGQQNDGKPPQRWQLDHLPQLIVGCQHLSRCAILKLLAALLCACTGTVQSAWISCTAGCCLSCSLCYGLGACSTGQS